MEEEWDKPSTVYSVEVARSSARSGYMENTHEERKCLINFSGL